jgi:hypothetical protein
VTVVKAAEADAESKYLSGLGIARQRQAIVNGLRESVKDFSDQVDGIQPQSVMELMLMTQVRGEDKRQCQSRVCEKRVTRDCHMHVCVCVCACVCECASMQPCASKVAVWRILVSEPVFLC